MRRASRWHHQEAGLGACLARIPNFVAIGLNYRDHAAETNSAIPAEPVVFNKHTASVSGPDDAIISPPGSRKLDWGNRAWRHHRQAMLASHGAVSDRLRRRLLLGE